MQKLSHYRTLKTIAIAMLALGLSACVPAPVQYNYYKNLGSYNSNQHLSLWAVIRQGYQINHEPNNPEVRYYVHYYANRPFLLDAIFQQSKPYLYLVTKQVEQRNMPTELALLPFIESGFRSRVTSRAGAQGIWQLMPGTARQYSLVTGPTLQTIDNSTDTALSYLNYLHDAFDGNWLLAIAAYNAGEGTVQNAIQKNLRLGKPTDFWNLQLPAQTKSYVPRLLAFSILIAHPHQYGISLPEIPNEPVVASVMLPGNTSLKSVADLAEVPVGALLELNPQFRDAYAIQPSGEYPILIPINHVSIYEQNLESQPDNHQILWKHYTVQTGDTLNRIALLTNTTVESLKQYNHLSSNTIYPGQKLTYPVTINNQKIQVYYVKSGDTLTSIARQFNVSLDDLMRWNALQRTSIITIGQKLVIR